MSHMFLLCFEEAVASPNFSRVQRPEKAVLNCNPPKRYAASAFAPGGAKPTAAGSDDDVDSEPEHVDNALAVSRFQLAAEFRVPSQGPGPAGRRGILPMLWVPPTAEWWVPARTTTTFPRLGGSEVHGLRSSAETGTEADSEAKAGFRMGVVRMAHRCCLPLR
jgi:hypothetical protein